MPTYRKEGATAVTQAIYFFDVCHTATCIQHTDNVISQAQADRRGECAAGLRTLKDCKGTGADPILLLALSTSPAVC